MRVRSNGFPASPSNRAADIHLRQALHFFHHISAFASEGASKSSAGFLIGGVALSDFDEVELRVAVSGHRPTLFLGHRHLANDLDKSQLYIIIRTASDLNATQNRHII